MVMDRFNSLAGLAKKSWVTAQIAANEIAVKTADAAKMAPSTVMAALIESYKVSVVQTGDIIKTTLVLDLTGAKSVATDKDIIGNTGICHIGQITEAINGTIVKGQLSCAEVPAGGADDIDLYSAVEGTGAYDAGIATLDETALVTSGGAHAVGTVKPFTALPAADEYLYLCSGEAAAGTYTAGKLMLELWGVAS